MRCGVGAELPLGKDPQRRQAQSRPHRPNAGGTRRPAPDASGRRAAGPAPAAGMRTWNRMYALVGLGGRSGSRVTAFFFFFLACAPPSISSSKSGSYAGGASPSDAIVAAAAARVELYWLISRLYRSRSRCGAGGGSSGPRVTQVGGERFGCGAQGQARAQVCFCRRCRLWVHPAAMSHCAAGCAMNERAPQARPRPPRKPGRTRGCKRRVAAARPPATGPRSGPSLLHPSPSTLYQSAA